ncbi:MAG: HAD-IA family hydrolase [Acidimicrobiia bacterium]
MGRQPEPAPPGPAPLDWLIVDFDGVLRHWDMVAFGDCAAEFGLEADDLAAIAFAERLIDAAMVGRLSVEAWATEIGRAAAEAHGADADAVAARFLSLPWSIDDEAVAVVRQARAGKRVQVALFSNATTALEEHLGQCGLDQDFDVVFNSARLGMAKPDPAAFTHVAGLLGTSPVRCLFVDDRADNVAGARAAGMRAVRYASAGELRSLLEKEGLLGGATAS